MRFVTDLEAIEACLRWRPFSLASLDLVKGIESHGCRPKMVVDVGANEGQFSRAAREIFGPDVDIFGFEPLSAVYERLTSNFAGDNRVYFRQLAMGDENGSAEINVNSFSQSSSLLSLGQNHKSAFPRAMEIGREIVAILRLDDALRDVEWRVPSLLKVDVQGYEMKVLDGAPFTLSQVDYVLVEVGLVPLYTEEPTYDEINNRLENAGLEFVASVATLMDDKKGIAIQMDALYKRRI